MPTLTRLIFILLAVGLLFYGAMWSLVIFVHPVVVEMHIDIPQSMINLRPWP